MWLTGLAALFVSLLTRVGQQILDHMNESGVYNESDLAPFHRRLTDLRHIIQTDVDGGKHPLAMTKLLERQLSECGMILFALISPVYIHVGQTLC